MMHAIVKIYNYRPSILARQFHIQLCYLKDILTALFTQLIKIVMLSNPNPNLERNPYHSRSRRYYFPVWLDQVDKAFGNIS